MIPRMTHRPPFRCAAALVVLALGLAGCASSGDLGDNLTTAFADPAKYDYYDCKQLEAERKIIRTHLDDLQRLMAKADTGVAGPVVAELAYRNDYLAYRGQAKFAEDAWRRNKCVETPPAPPTAAVAVPAVPASAKSGRTPRNSASYPLNAIH